MKILIPLAEGFEEIEAVTIIDILRRAGADVTVAALHGKTVTGSHGISIVADSMLRDMNPSEIDAIILPGGMPGTLNLKDSRELTDILLQLQSKARLIGAICAAPLVLGNTDLLKGKNFTSHPTVAGEFQSNLPTGKPVEIDNKLITGRSAGAAMKFAFAIVRELFGEEKVREINKTVLAEI